MAQNWATINRRRRSFVIKYSRAWKDEYILVGREVERLILKWGDAVEQHIPLIQFPGIERLWGDMYADCGVAFAKDGYNIYIKSKKGIEQKAAVEVTPMVLVDSWTDRMLAYAFNEAGDFIVSIQRTAREDMLTIVGNILAEGFEIGTSRDSMAEKIAKQFVQEWGDSAEWKGKRIAQTEMIRASNYGTLQGVEALGIPYDRVWYSGGAGVRPTHAEANGQVVDSQDPFIIGGWQAFYPGDPTLPPEESINCRCAVSARPKGGY